MVQVKWRQEWETELLMAVPLHRNQELKCQCRRMTHLELLHAVGYLGKVMRC